ncbi:hypothetical protein ACF0H5_000230 [Mactra antiquata]
MVILCNNGPTVLDGTTRIIIKPEDTPINETIGKIQARDDDGPQQLKFSIPAGHPTESIVRLDNVRGDSSTPEGRTVDIVLIKQLDRDYASSSKIKLIFVIEDDPEGDGNRITEEISLYVTDVNDENPKFVQNRYEHDVLESSPLDFSVTQVSASDPDQGVGGRVKYSMEPVGQAISDTYKNAFKIDPTTGDVRVNGTLDANVYNYYEYKLTATDGGDRTGYSVLLIKIQDVQDKPPYFTNLPYSKNILENATLGTSVLQVTALDGDKGDPNIVQYSFVSGDFKNFAIDSSTGWITVKSTLDRDGEDVRESGGVYVIYVKAKEIDDSQAENLITATTLVTITVEDVNDNGPIFNSPTYEAFILENMQDGVPITFNGPGSISVMNASDLDQGVNTQFSLTLEKDGKPYTDFTPIPNKVYVESSILIQVSNTSALDYEKVTELTFQIVARETGTVEKRSSSADITVKIRDMNDNTPIFSPSTVKDLTIRENATIGTVLTMLTASDADTGDFGSITFHIRGSNTVFQIDEQSGKITLVGPLDREKVDVYFLTAEARDGGGFTAFVNLVVKVLDINDEKPVFLREEYYVTVREDSLNFLRGDLVVEATDDDEPGSPNSDIMYQISTASYGLKDKFFVNESSGIVQMVEKIDFESLPAELDGRVTLVIEAYDLGDPRLSNTIDVIVEIEDVNDNAPVFNQTTYTAIITESAASGDQVIQVFATDGDRMEPNNQILYRIDSGAGDKFRIDFQTGEIIIEVGAKLDRETKYQYMLDVSATDRGATPLTGLCSVNITVTDVNDEAPVFDVSTVSASVSENAAIGTTVECVVATDPDTTYSLSYSLIHDVTTGYDENGRSVNVTVTGVQDYFDIDGSNGCITVKNQLDREIAETVVIRVKVTDDNALIIPGSENTQTAIAVITVTLSDYNDNPPKFLPDSSYSLRISEGLEEESEVLRFETLDKDKTSVITYEMYTDDDNNFMVTENTGILKLNKQLDREKTPTLTIKVVAKDNGNPQLSSIATVNIDVQDINDNAPVFGPYATSYSISEDSDIGDHVATILATDEDLNDFGNVVYYFDVSNDDGNLKINRTTGEITVAKTLDRETRSIYTLYVTATDNPNNPSKQRTNQTKAIAVQILDVNDNSPEFTNIDSDTRARVLKNAWDPNKEGFLVFTVNGEDKDINQNAELEYSLSADNSVKDLFVISTVQRTVGGVPKYDGEIRVASSLTDNVGELHVTVTIKDKGVPSMSSQTDLVIVVEDVNLNKPVFTKPVGPRASISTLEKRPVGTAIIQIETTDADHGRNAEIVYSLEPENDWEKFAIDSVTGELTNAEILDREVKDFYQIKIKAEDRGVPTPRHSTLSLKIVMLDVDDNPPEFQVDRFTPYKIRIEEERVLDQTTTSLDIAIDRDSGNNSIICYYIIGGDKEVTSHFSLDQNGNLTLTRSFDRENLTVPYINMIILASPSCYLNMDINQRPPVYPPTDYERNKTLLWVQVEITDINDNPPKFKQSVLTLGVTRDTGFGTSITNLQDLISDDDATMKVEFMAICTENHLQRTQTPCVKAQNPKDQPFLVFKNGTVATNTYFQANMYGYYLIQIQAKENVTGGEPFLANATLRISLINDDQRVKVVFRNTPDVVRDFQVAFTQKLQQTTGYRIVVDKIQTHENSAGFPEVNKTDMFIHGENMKTNETISATELLRVIDSYAEALLTLRYDYKVLEIVPTTVASQEQNLEDVFKMALILVTIFLTLLCVALCIIFYISIQQYKRKLKAATAMAYGSNSDLHKLELPGTNVHAYENTNPIYLEKVLLEEAGEQDDDDSLDNNAVDTNQQSQTSEQQMSMNFYTEDNNLNKVPESKLGNGDAMLNAAIQHHEELKQKQQENIHQNGLVENKKDNFAGLPTTEI